MLNTVWCQLPNFSEQRHQAPLIWRHSPDLSPEDRHLQSELIRAWFAPFIMQALCMNKGFQSKFCHLPKHTSFFVTGAVGLLRRGMLTSGSTLKTKIQGSALPSSQHQLSGVFGSQVFTEVPQTCPSPAPGI